MKRERLGLALIALLLPASLRAAITIRNIRVVDRTATTFTVACETDVPAGVFIDYGETAGYGATEHGNHDLALVHRIEVWSGVKPATLYHFRVYAWNDADQEFSPDMTVTTLGGAAKPGDLNGDGAVGIADLSLFLARWNTADAAADLDGSGRVDIGDLSRLLAQWGH